MGQDLEALLGLVKFTFGRANCCAMLVINIEEIKIKGGRERLNNGVTGMTGSVGPSTCLGSCSCL